MRLKQSHRWLLAVVAMFGLYVTSYAVLSRRGHADADRANHGGFYYVPPKNTDRWRLQNSFCVFLFWPLNLFDQWFFSGRGPASDPLWELSST